MAGDYVVKQANVRQRTQGILAREHVSSQGTLTHESMSTQGTLTRETRKHSRNIDT